MSNARPDLSVVVPTYGRPDLLAGLLAGLANQTLAPERFEVVAVDDGSPTPIQQPTGALPFRTQLLRQSNAGPGAARNLAFAHCTAPLALILNDDAVPAPDLLERHLEIHAGAPAKTAVLGAFPFTAGSRQSPFVQLMAESDLLFDFGHLRHGEFHDWRFFWTCNLSLPLAALREVGGFDADRFREPLMEDVELGYRLGLRGWRVLYREDARCEHDHRLTPAGYFHRMRRYGFHLIRMWQKHGDPQLLGVAREDLVEPSLQRVQLQYEELRETWASASSKLEALERTHQGQALAPRLLEDARRVVATVRVVPMARGICEALSGSDPEVVATRGPTPGALTSVIAVSRNSLLDTRVCLEALRRTAEPGLPTELLFVDNGSDDGSAAFLREQTDVDLIENAENLGAPHARNQALQRAKGDWIVFLDNDVTVYPGWLRRLRYHAEVDPSVGCVLPVADRAAHGQQVSAPPAGDGLAAFAARCAAESDRRASYKKIFSSLCVLLRREVIASIGGFDERFSPWGFEDDDFSLRVHLAGYRARLALDVFVHHAPYSGPKSVRHRSLLERNWRRFAAKWGGADDARYGSYDFLGPVMAKHWPAEALRVPLPGAAGGPP